MAKLPAGSSKKNYVTDPKTGKPLSVNPKKVQEAGVGSVGKMAIKLGVKVAQKAIKTATDSNAQKKLYKEKVTIPAKKVVKAAKQEIKIEAKALKAANKPVKSKDADLINRNNPYARSAILSEKPARANRTRLGKDAFKSK